MNNWGTVSSSRRFLLHGFSLFITQINTVVQAWSSVFYCPYFILEYHKVMSLVVSTGVRVLNVWFDTTPLALNSYINSFLWRTMHILTGLKVSRCTIRASPTALELFWWWEWKSMSHLAIIKMSYAFCWGWKLIISQPDKCRASSDLMVPVTQIPRLVVSLVHSNAYLVPKL